MTEQAQLEVATGASDNPRMVIRGWNGHTKGLSTDEVRGAERLLRGASSALEPDLQENEISAHEGQTSGLAARSGALMLDYLRARLPDDRVIWACLHEWLGPMQERPIGWRGWYDRSAYVLDGGLVAWCSERENAEREGVLVDLPGKACACLGEQLVPFLRWCSEVGSVRRADYALDDRAGRLTFERVEAARCAGSIVMRWTESQCVKSNNGRTGELQGWTVYLGSRRSEAMVRIYDKGLEQGLEGGQWVRLELETKGKLADALARCYFAEGAAAVVGQINRRVRFAIPIPTDDRRRRWPTAPWWAELLGSVEPGASLLCGEKQCATIDDMRDYVERQAGPSIATILRADGGDLAWLMKATDDGERRMRPKHYAALALAEREALAP